MRMGYKTHCIFIAGVSGPTSQGRPGDPFSSDSTCIRSSFVCFNYVRVARHLDVNNFYVIIYACVIFRLRPSELLCWLRSSYLKFPIVGSRKVWN